MSLGIGIDVTLPLSPDLPPFACDPGLYTPRLWSGTLTRDESCFLVDGAAKLLHPASSIIAVRSMRKDVSYVQGVDWTYNAGTQSIERVGTRIASTSAASLASGSPYGVAFSESTTWHNAQIAVTYNHPAISWAPPVTSLSAKLTTTLGKLNAGQPVKVLFYGDSIAQGASTYELVPPHQLVWWSAVVALLRVAYPTAPITPINTAEAGQTSAFGLANVAARVVAYAPDLVFIGWGMNDGSANMSAGTFAANVSGQITAIRAAKPATEIVLVSPPFPNPASTLVGTHATLLAPLQTIAAGAGIELIDMTTTHAALIAAKGYHSLTGNGVNHPNDYVGRWCSQLALNLLGG